MSHACPDYRATLRLSRRSLLKAGSAGIAGLSLPILLRASEAAKAGPAAKAKHVIFLHQFGGPSHIDTFDMKPDAPDGIRGEFKPIASTQPGLTVCELLPEFSKVIGKFAQVRSVNHRMKNHNSATYYSLTGHAPPLDDIRLRDTQELYPAYGSTVAKLKPVDDPAVPTFVAYPHVLRDGSVTPGQTASFLGKPFDPFFIGQDPNSPDFRLPELTPAGEPAPGTARRPPRPAAGHRRAGRPAQLVGYGAGDRLVLRPRPDDARLAEGQAGVRPVEGVSEAPRRLRPDDLRPGLPAGEAPGGGGRAVRHRLLPQLDRRAAASDGWDTHGDNFNQLKKYLLPKTDMAVPTLVRDLEARGLLDETLIVWMGEFGRSPKVINTAKFGANGRDHWPRCYTVLMAGGGITPGADLRRQRPDRRLPGARPGLARRRRRDDVLGPRDRPCDRVLRRPAPPPADRRRQADHADLLVR